MKSYDVKFWAIRPGKAKTKRTYEVRWKVGHAPQSRTIGNKAQAENFLSELRQAARAGESFDTGTGLPASMTTVQRKRSWLEFSLAYVDMKWPSAAPKTRDAMIDALASVIPALVSEEPPEQLDVGSLRSALRHFLLAPPSRTLDRPPTAAAALRWLEKASLPVSEVGTPKHAPPCSIPSVSCRMAAPPAQPPSPANDRSSPTCSGTRSKWKSCPPVR